MSNNKNIALVFGGIGIAVVSTLIGYCATKQEGPFVPSPPAATATGDPREAGSGVPLKANYIDAKDNLNHWMAVWTITETVQVPTIPKDAVYHPNAPENKNPPTHPETKRTVCAKEFKTRQELDAFIANAPKDVKGRISVVNEDQ